MLTESGCKVTSNDTFTVVVYADGALRQLNAGCHSMSASTDKSPQLMMSTRWGMLRCAMLGRAGLGWSRIWRVIVGFPPSLFNCPQDSPSCLHSHTCSSCMCAWCQASLPPSTQSQVCAAHCTRGELARTTLAGSHTALYVCCSSSLSHVGLVVHAGGVRCCIAIPGPLTC